MHGLALSLSTLLFGQLIKVSAFVSPSRLFQRYYDENHQMLRVSPNMVKDSSLSTGKGEDVLSLDKISEMIDTSFVNACMQLAQGYVDVLKLLIVAVKSGYEIGVSPSELIKKIDAVPNKAAGRDLMPEEIELRNTWIQVVYFVLKESKHRSNDEKAWSSIDEVVIAPFRLKYSILKTRKDNGQDSYVDDLIDSEDGLKKPLDVAIATQSLRVMWYTLVILEEEERCQTDFARQDAPLKPPIPGAF